jgi:hypothetical protein
MGRNLTAFLTVQSGAFWFLWPNLFATKRLSHTRFEGYLIGSLLIAGGFVYLFRGRTLDRVDFLATGRRATFFLSVACLAGLWWVYQHTAFESSLLGTAPEPAPRGILTSELVKVGFVWIGVLPLGLLGLRAFGKFQSELQSDPAKEDRFRDLLAGAQPNAAEQTSMAKTNRVVALILVVAIAVIYAVIVRQFLVH